jgi:hypothetical protein
MSTTTYRVTISGLLIADAHELIKAVFPSADPLRMTYSQEFIEATFATPQIPADLGPLVKVELVTQD